ncbi:hypothetical protein Tco_0845888 [Tanacetum coccineum]
MQKYMLKGCPIFLAHVTTKVTEDKLEKKRPLNISPWSSPLPQIPSPLLPVSPPPPVSPPLPVSPPPLPAIPTYPLGYRAAMIRQRPTTGFKEDYGFVATLDREIRRDPERDVGYGITDTWDEMLEGMPGAPATDETELGRRMTNFVTTVRQDTDEIYGRLDEAHEARAALSGQLNLLGRDKRSYAYTALLMK